MLTAGGSYRSDVVGSRLEFVVGFVEASELRCFVSCCVSFVVAQAVLCLFVVLLQLPLVVCRRHCLLLVVKLWLFAAP